ncbi:MAG: plastocyanin/azurin family copper-binding protein, partial [Chloroflexota bacterium]|nr:plastocyanin/azurin family copper-binding protein [Chloroflexota bacterium]
MAHGGAYSNYATRLAGLALAVVLAGVPVVADAATARVSIQGFAFSPAATTVSAGDAVTWKDLDGVQHTATADNGAWTTGVLNSGQTSAAITFTVPGVFTYHCAIHPSMTGSITVLAAATPRPTAPPPPPPTPVPAPVRT